MAKARTSSSAAPRRSSRISAKVSRPVCCDLPLRIFEMRSHVRTCQAKLVFTSQEKAKAAAPKPAAASSPAKKKKGAGPRTQAAGVKKTTKAAAKTKKTTTGKTPAKKETKKEAKTKDVKKKFPPPNESKRGKGTAAPQCNTVALKKKAREAREQAAKDKGRATMEAKKAAGKTARKAAGKAEKAAKDAVTKLSPAKSRSPSKSPSRASPSRKGSPPPKKQPGLGQKLGEAVDGIASNATNLVADMWNERVSCCLADGPVGE